MHQFQNAYRKEIFSACRPADGEDDAGMGRSHAKEFLELQRGKGFAQPNPRPMFTTLQDCCGSKANYAGSYKALIRGNRGRSFAIVCHG
jgi:hypothetical protein